MTQRVSYKSKRSFYLRRKKVKHIIHSDWAGGAILLGFTILALLLANIDATKEFYHHILSSKIGFQIGGLEFSRSLEFWVNDALMVIFFFAVGLEIKREVLFGRLANVKNASLPMAAALGGMIVPALIYACLNHGTIYEAGWGIPMATDIAFALGVLSVLGSRVPLSLKIFLTALAIVDDLGSILVIAIFYSGQINFIMLFAALGVLAIMWLLNKENVYSMGFYLAMSLVLWILFLSSGVHVTIAGVLVAMTIPSTPRYSKSYFLYKSKFFIEDFRFHDKKDLEVISNDEQLCDLNASSRIAHGAVSPSQHLEHKLHNWVTFVILPIFALTNAGVYITGINEFNIFNTTQSMGIFFGLVFGKPLGIALFSYLSIKLKLAQMPEGASWGMLLAIAVLGGIGFTMSIFVEDLAFVGTNIIDKGKISVLLASFTAAIIGSLAIYLLAKRKKC